MVFDMDSTLIQQEVSRAKSRSQWAHEGSEGGLFNVLSIEKISWP